VLSAQVLLYTALIVVNIACIAVWVVTSRRRRLAGRPAAADIAIGVGTNFLDTLGIGNYAQITALFKLRGHPPDELIPGTLNVGNAVPSFLGSFLVGVGHRRQQGVKPAVAAFGVKPIPVDPCGQPLQRGRIEMDGPSLRVAGPGDEPRLLEHLNVLGHRLFRDVERRRQLVDRGRAAGQPRDDGPPNRVGQRHEGAVQPGVCISITPQLSTLRLINRSIDYKGRRWRGGCQGLLSASCG